MDNVKTSYNGDDIYTNRIRGAENALINLAEEFSKSSNDVTVYNNCTNNINNIR